MTLIAVDMDNVVADWDQGLVDRWVAARPNRPYVRLENRKNFYADEDYPEEDRHFVKSLHRSPGFYRELKPMPGALYALNTMKDLNFDVILLTSPEVHDSCAQEKVGWVREHLGDDWVHHLVLSRDKTLVRADKLIVGWTTKFPLYERWAPQRLLPPVGTGLQEPQFTTTLRLPKGEDLGCKQSFE